jgi:hypothetical protein
MLIMACLVILLCGRSNLVQRGGGGGGGPLKVVGNEKGGGSGGWLLFEDAFGPWRSMSVFLFNVAIVFFSTYFRFLFVKPSKQAIEMKIGKAHRNIRSANWRCETYYMIL